MPEQFSHRGEVLQEDNPELKAAARKKAERKLGAKILSGVGFQDRQREVVDASLAKERARGEKFEGKNQARRNEAYLERLDRIIEKDGTALEEKLWEKSVDNLIIEPENIEENYWRTQEQVLRDNGQGRELGDYEKQILTEDIQKRQRESLRSWANYLGNEDAPYPMWFKVYAWDGVSKMGVFDKEKGEFKVRNKHTVAPYPKLNPAVLAKVHGAISDFYGHKDEERYREGEERDEELEVLVRSGNFNRLYSKFLLEQKSIPPTPERTEDVHGSWIEYLPGQEEALANAAEGTPWCIADPGTAKSYLERGVYGQADDEDWEDWDDEEGAESKAKFILFHLEDPETGNLAENACASIRLGTDGQVAEISGLKDGSKQVLEDSLVPIVEEKVKTLPGGEKFLEAFADKQKLIELDRKMQRGEELTGEEVGFIFERDGKIRTINEYSNDDSRVKELRGYVLAHLGNSDNIDLGFIIKKATGEEIASYFEPLVTNGVDINKLVDKLRYYPEVVIRNFDRLVEFGADANVLTQYMDGDAVSGYFERLVEAGVDVNVLVGQLPQCSLSGYFGRLVELGADANLLMKNMSPVVIGEHLDWFVSHGVDMNEIAQRMDSERYFDRLLELGVDIDKLEEILKSTKGRAEVYRENKIKNGVETVDVDERIYRINEQLNRLEQMGSAGGREKLRQSVEQMTKSDVVAQFEQLLEAGVDADVVLERFDNIYDIGTVGKFVRAGANPEELMRKIGNVDRLFDGLLGLGLSPDVVAERLFAKDIEKRFDQLVELGVNPNVFIRHMDREDVNKQFDQLLELGAVPEDLVSVVGGIYVAKHIDKLLSLGIDVYYLAEEMYLDGLLDNFDHLVELGADPEKLKRIISKK